MTGSITEIRSGPLAASAAGRLTHAVRRALADALSGRRTIEPGLLEIGGMSGRKYRTFINGLIGSLPDARYLEVGSWAGSTLCSAINGNAVTALAIDNWSEFGGPRDAFQANLAMFRTAEAQVRFLESDFRAVDFAAQGSFNVYLFDGPHAEADQFDGISLAQPALDDAFVLIIDDWNWEQVRTGTFRALERIGLETLHMLEIRTTLDNTHPEVAFQHSDWHNGYFIGVLRK